MMFISIVAVTAIFVGFASGQQTPSYCLFAPNANCYPGGWPSCCTNSTETCPETQPPCLVGASICTWAPNTDCYGGDGFPECCESDPGSCPSADNPPPCLDGNSPCTYGPDYTCYTSGWPSCCTDGTCDTTTTKQECDVTPDGSSICTYAPNYGCWPATNGFPECCENDPSSCPATDPACTSVGGPCSATPNYTCYRNGYPECCLTSGSTCGDANSGDLDCNLVYAPGTGASDNVDGVDQATVGEPAAQEEALGSTENEEDTDSNATSTTEAPESTTPASAPTTSRSSASSTIVDGIRTAMSAATTLALLWTML